MRLQALPTGSIAPGSRAGSQRTSGEAELPLTFERIAGGHSNLTYRVTDVAGRRWALRRPPLGKRLGSAHDMAREHRVVSALAATAVPVAPVVGLCEDESVNEAPFYVMEFVEGPDPARAGGGRGLPGPGRPPARSPSASSTRWSRSTLSIPTPPVSASSAEGGLRRPPAASLAGPVGEVEDPGAAARRRGPRPARGAHPRAGAGDDRPRRLPARQHDPDPEAGEVAAVVDWELCTLGDPLADVGLLMVYWPSRGRRRPRSASRPTSPPASPTARSCATATPSAPDATSPNSISSSPSATGSWRSSSRGSTPLRRGRLRQGRRRRRILRQGRREPAEAADRAERAE